MTLRDYIMALCLDGTPEQITEVLNTRSIPSCNASPCTGTGIADEIGPTLARQALAGIEAAMQQDPLLRAWYNELTSTGVDFSSPRSQQLIDHLQKTGFLSEDLATRLKQIGIRYISPYEQFAGDGAVVTLEQVKEALQATGEEEIRIIIQGDIRERSRLLEITIMGVARDGSDRVTSQHSFHFTGKESTGNIYVDELAQAILSAAYDYMRVRQSIDFDTCSPESMEVDNEDFA